MQTQRMVSSLGVAKSKSMRPFLTVKVLIFRAKIYDANGEEIVSPDGPFVLWDVSPIKSETNGINGIGLAGWCPSCLYA